MNNPKSFEISWIWKRKLIVCTKKHFVKICINTIVSLFNFVTNVTTNVRNHVCILSSTFLRHSIEQVHQRSVKSQVVIPHVRQRVQTSLVIVQGIAMIVNPHIAVWGVLRGQAKSSGTGDHRNWTTSLFTLFLSQTAFAFVPSVLEPDLDLGRCEL